LPDTSPEADQPPGLKLPLREHQLRALHRCEVIEAADEEKNKSLSGEDFGESLNGNFGNRFDFQSRGGCLADEVGTGKTATSIGLVLSGIGEGDTLVVAPAHLIPQWEQEIHKFAQANAIEVIVGKKEYERKCSCPPISPKRRIVLVDVDSILNETKLWYNFRRVFTSKEGKQLKVDKAKLQLYRKAALFCVKSPKGPCDYEGWVYTGSLHLPQRPWRRVIYDEIQDLIAEGTESQKNLLQLSRTAQNVWLLSATPFPHGNTSVYANHELLGFCRLRMDVEVDYPLPSNHTFERIKRKLYIRSPRHVADQAVAATVTRRTEYVPRLELEQRFYNLEEAKIRSENAGNAEVHNLFSTMYYPLREMTVHPEASAGLRQVFSSSSSPHQHHQHIRAVSTSVQGAARRAIRDAKQRLRQLAASHRSAENLAAVAKHSEIVAFGKKGQGISGNHPSFVQRLSRKCRSREISGTKRKGTQVHS
jgi:superfamily II DNA or RNA helicase